MSDLISAIAYDIDMYEYRCKKYDEEVQYTRDYYLNLVVDCYGEHATKLYELDEKEVDK
jgi:hypothetical protein